MQKTKGDQRALFTSLIVQIKQAYRLRAMDKGHGFTSLIVQIKQRNLLYEKVT